MPRRIRISLAYDGTDFHGWQVQPGLTTIQGILEGILGEMEGKPVHVAGSGRTDAGVHALAQVAAFTFENPLPMDNLRRALNRLLPPTIRILAACETHAEFHPRFDACAKTYRYVLFRGETCSPFEWRYVHYHPYPLNEEWMRRGARLFEGTHDFTVFSAKDARGRLNAACLKSGVAKSAVARLPGRPKTRTIFHSQLEREGETLVYLVRGNGFLKHMVRNLVGTLIEMGRGNLSHTKIPYKSGSTVPAKGLTMVSVEYPHVTLNP